MDLVRQKNEREKRLRKWKLKSEGNARPEEDRETYQTMRDLKK